MLEHHRHAAQAFGIVAVPLGPFDKPVVDPQIVPAAAHVVRDEHVEQVARLGRFCTDAGERRIGDMRAELCFDIAGDAIVDR